MTCELGCACNCNLAICGCHEAVRALEQLIPDRERT